MEYNELTAENAENAKTGGTGVSPVWRLGLASKTNAHTGGTPMPPGQISSIPHFSEMRPCRSASMCRMQSAFFVTFCAFLRPIHLPDLR